MSPLRDGAHAPPLARAFNVAPHPGEEISVAVGRARRVHDSALPAVEGLYDSLEGSWDTRTIYPLHPATASALRSLCRSDTTVGRLAKAVREVIEPWYGDRDFQRLIMPAALMRSAAVREMLDAHLGESGRAALRVANATAATKAGDDHTRNIAQALVDTLVLLHIGGAAAMVPVGEIRERMDLVGLGGTGVALTQALTTLARRTQGVILYDARAQSASFNPRGGGSPDLAAFNSALALVRSFDPSLTAAHESLDLTAKRARLKAAMAAALESAYRNREALAGVMRESGAQLALAQRQAFAEFIELAEGGPAALIELGSDPLRRAAAIAAIAAYEAIASVVDSIPRLTRMREYLAATRLPTLAGEETGRDRALVALETECQMLAVALNPVALASGGRNINTLEDRFQTFKSTYVQNYRSGHEHHRLVLQRCAPVVEDAHRHLDALGRLNAIAALGAPEGADLNEVMIALDRRLTPCDLDGSLAPEVTPCCPRCGYTLSMASPREELDDLGARVRCALQSKLAALAQSAIARLIRQHDSSRRLEGFLKIVQAAQTEALSRLLDEELAGYLARMLNENAAGDADNAATDCDLESPPIAEPRVAPDDANNNGSPRGRGSRRSKFEGRNGRTF